MGILHVKKDGQRADVISKRAMYRICASKDREILFWKGEVKDCHDVIDNMILINKRLAHERKLYLILSVVTTIFGVIGYMV